MCAAQTCRVQTRACQDCFVCLFVFSSNPLICILLVAAAAEEVFMGRNDEQRQYFHPPKEHFFSLILFPGVDSAAQCNANHYG